MAKAAYPTIGIAALVMFGIVYFIGCLHYMYTLIIMNSRLLVVGRSSHYNETVVSLK